MSSPYKLLSPAASSPKQRKHASDFRLHAALLYLAPATNAGGPTVCAGSDLPCFNACLYESGQAAVFKTINAARIRKTRFFHDDRDGFMAELARDIGKLQARAIRDGLRPVVRLNGTSDIPWESVACTVDGIAYKSVIDAFPEVQFYDYTKLPGRINRSMPTNYHVTFSLSGTNDRIAQRALDRGYNVAVVFPKRAVPAEWSGYPVINGDEHDFRYLDPSGPGIVGLSAKGLAIGDDSGFVRDPNGALDLSRVPQFATAAHRAN